jgi:hypothetical protein
MSRDGGYPERSDLCEQKAEKQSGPVHIKRLNYIRVIAIKHVFQNYSLRKSDQLQRISNIPTKVCIGKAHDFASSVAFVRFDILLEREGKIE